MAICKEEVQQRSYLIWESEGRPGGRELDHWLQAEAELAKEQAESNAVAAPAAAKPKSRASAAKKRSKAG